MSNSTIFATSSSRDVFSTIEEELDLFTALYETLEAQQQNILSRNGQNMADTAKEITNLLEEAQECRIERSDKLRRNGLSNTPEGMRQFFQQFSSKELSSKELSSKELSSKEHQDDWQELIELVERCKALNLKNGETLKIQREHSDKQLRRLANRQQKSSYSASGHSVANAEPTLRAQA